MVAMALRPSAPKWNAGRVVTGILLRKFFGARWLALKRAGCRNKNDRKGKQKNPFLPTLTVYLLRQLI